MADVQATRITKPSVNNPHEHTCHLASTVNLRHSTRERVIAIISNSLNEFYVIDPKIMALAYIAVVRKSRRARRLHNCTEGQRYKRF